VGSRLRRRLGRKAGALTNTLESLKIRASDAVALALAPRSATKGRWRRRAARGARVVERQTKGQLDFPGSARKVRPP